MLNGYLAERDGDDRCRPQFTLVLVSYQGISEDSTNSRSSSIASPIPST